MENLIKMDDLGVQLFFGNTHEFVVSKSRAGSGVPSFFNSKLPILKFDMEPEVRSPWKFGDSFWKPSFSGSMLNFGGVPKDVENDWQKFPKMLTF